MRSRVDYDGGERRGARLTRLLAGREFAPLVAAGAGAQTGGSEERLAARLARRLGATARGEFGIAGRRQLYARFVNCASRNMSGCWTKGLLY